MQRFVRWLWLFSFAAYNWANASTVPPGAYDGRSLAMGGTGVSHIHSGAAVYHNPANMNDMRHGAFTLDFTGFSPTITSPLSGPQTALSSDFSLYPLFLVGGGYRVFDRVVVGFAVYPTAGFGSGYSKVAVLNGEDYKLTVLMMEASPAVSVRVFDNLSLGLGYRITYARETAHGPGPSGDFADTTLTGTNFAGAQVGLNYRLTDEWQFGASYASKVDTTLSGKTTSRNGSADVGSSFASPHTFKFGTSYWFLDKRFLLALDLKYMLYADANKELDTTVATPSGPVTFVTPLAWKNVLSAGLGGEYWMSSVVALRAGYFISQSATPVSTASYFTVPPGVINSFHLGAGFALPSWDFDIGGLYAFNGKQAEPAQPMGPAFPANPGRYYLTSLIFSLSATYHR